MIAVALKGLAGRKVRALLTALAIVIGVSMVSGTFILTDTMQKSFNGLFTDDVGQDRRRHQRQGDRQELHQRQRRHDPGSDARQGPGAARGRGGRGRRQPRPRRTSPTSSARTARPSPRRASAAAMTPPTPASARSSSRPASRRTAPARSRSTPAPPRSTTTRSATPSSSRPSARSTRYRISGTVSFGSVDSLGFASIAAWDVKTAQTLLQPRGPLRRASRSPRSTARRPRSSCRRSSRCCPPSLQVKDSAKQAKDDAKDAQRRDGDDPLGAARLRRASRCSSAAS